MLNITIDNPIIENYFSHSPKKVLKFIENIVKKEIEKKDKIQSVSREAESFLELGGTNYWSENLKEMRKNKLNKHQLML